MKNYNDYLILGKPDIRDRVRNRITAIGLFEKIRKRLFTTRKQKIRYLETIIKGHWKIIRNKVIKTWQHLDR